jgi:hypothetical protein
MKKLLTVVIGVILLGDFSCTAYSQNADIEYKIEKKETYHSVKLIVKFNYITQATDFSGTFDSFIEEGYKLQISEQLTRMIESHAALNLKKEYASYPKYVDNIIGMIESKDKQSEAYEYLKDELEINSIQIFPSNSTIRKNNGTIKNNISLICSLKVEVNSDTNLKLESLKFEFKGKKYISPPINISVQK